MNWSTVPEIEFEVFIAACPLEQWIPRIAVPEGSRVLGNGLSTLYVVRKGNGTVGFYSHDVREIEPFRSIIEEYFGVRIV